MKYFYDEIEFKKSKHSAFNKFIQSILYPNLIFLNIKMQPIRGKKEFCLHLYVFLFKSTESYEEF